MNKSVLYIGPLNKNGTCYQRLLSFERIFYTVVRIDTYVYKNNSFIYLFNALLNKFNIWLDFVNANKLIKSQNFNYDIVWIDKGLTIKKSTLLKIKTVNKKIIHYSPDDMLNPRNQSKRYLNCISIYVILILIVLIKTILSFNTIITFLRRSYIKLYKHTR
jgi:hypothetical protein